MGYDIKRVPLDFSWPQKKVWKGFTNPHGDDGRETCPTCSGKGDSPEVLLLSAKWYGYAPFKPEDRGSVPWTPEDPVTRRWAERQCRMTPEFYGTGEGAIHRESLRICALWNRSWSHHLNDDDVQALLDEDRLWELTKVWTGEKGWQPRPDYVKPTARQVNEWSLMGFGHDGINQAIVVRAEAKRLGHPLVCAHCEGEGVLWTDSEARARYETWCREEPPTGEGFQLWENVTEGSPVSPVFALEEDLARWLVVNNVDETTGYSQWLELIRSEGSVPTMVLTAEGPKTGASAF